MPNCWGSRNSTDRALVGRRSAQRDLQRRSGRRRLGGDAGGQAPHRVDPQRRPIHDLGHAREMLRLEAAGEERDDPARLRLALAPARPAGLVHGSEANGQIEGVGAEEYVLEHRRLGIAHGQRDDDAEGHAIVDHRVHEVFDEDVVARELGGDGRDQARRVGAGHGDQYALEVHVAVRRRSRACPAGYDRAWSDVGGARCPHHPRISG